MSETQNQQEANKRAAQRIFDVWNGDDEDAIDEVMAEDVILHGHPEQVRGRVRGREAYKENLRMIRAGFPDQFFEANQVVAEDDIVMAYCTWGGTHEGELFGIEPTGNSVEVADFVSYRFDNGNLVEVISLPDLFGTFLQLGIIEPPGR